MRIGGALLIVLSLLFGFNPLSGTNSGNGAVAPQATGGAGSSNLGANCFRDRERSVHRRFSARIFTRLHEEIGATQSGMEVQSTDSCPGAAR